MSVLKLKCDNQLLSILTTPFIASGAKEINEINVEFNSSWNNFGKTAVFYREETKAYHVVLAENKCVIPHEVLINDGVLYFGIFGVNGKKRITTNVLRYKVVKGAILEGQTPQEPTPEIYEQILSVYGQIVAKYESIFNDINKIVADAVLQGVVNQNRPDELCKFWFGTKAEYDALGSKDANTIYYVTDDTGVLSYIEDFKEADPNHKRDHTNIVLKDGDGKMLYPRISVYNIVDKSGDPYRLSNVKYYKAEVTCSNGKISVKYDDHKPLSDYTIKILNIEIIKNPESVATINYIHNFRTSFIDKAGSSHVIEILDPTYSNYNGDVIVHYLDVEDFKW